jgi:ribosomal protein L7Ae-like RNA K-turn-binding protein
MAPAGSTTKRSSASFAITRPVTMQRRSGPRGSSAPAWDSVGRGVGVLLGEPVGARRHDDGVRLVLRQLHLRLRHLDELVAGEVADVVERLDAFLAERCRELIGLARRAGQAVAGFEKVRETLRRGNAGVLLAASDGAAGGREKLRALAPEIPVLDVLSSAELAAAFGRDHAVHALVSRGPLAERLKADAARLAGFRRTPATKTGEGRPAWPPAAEQG